MVSIFLTSALTITIFVILHVLLKYKEVKPNAEIRNFVTGGAAWSIISIFILIPNFWQFNSYQYSSYLETLSPNFDDDRLSVFLIVLLGSLLSETLRYWVMQDKRYFSKTYLNAVFFGLGFAVGEFLTKYLFFFDVDIDDKFQLQLIFFIGLIALHISLSILILRADENTKFVMFAAFIRFFFDLSYVGIIGFQLEITVVLQDLGFMVIMLAIMTYLSILTRKFPPKDEMKAISS